MGLGTGLLRKNQPAMLGAGQFGQFLVLLLCFRILLATPRRARCVQQLLDDRDFSTLAMAGKSLTICAGASGETGPAHLFSLPLQRGSPSCRLAGTSPELPSPGYCNRQVRTWENQAPSFSLSLRLPLTPGLAQSSQPWPPDAA